MDNSTEESHRVIADFVADYQRNQIHFERVKQEVEVAIDLRMKQVPDLRFLLSSRLKEPDSLRKKLVKRLENGSRRYANNTAIYDDVRDLIGLRLGLYNYRHLEATKNVIFSLFEHIGDDRRHGGAGYRAYHIQIFVKNPVLDRTRLSVEIQLMTLPMLAIMENEHERYKGNNTDKKSSRAHDKLYALGGEVDGIIETTAPPADEMKNGLRLPPMVPGVSRMPLSPVSPGLNDADCQSANARYECHNPNCRKKLWPESFHYFDILESDPHTLHSPANPQSEVSFKIKIGENGSVSRHRCTLQSFLPTNIMATVQSTVREVLKRPDASIVKIRWKRPHYWYIRGEFETLNPKDTNAMAKFYSIIGDINQLKDKLVFHLAIDLADVPNKTREQRHDRSPRNIWRRAKSPAVVQEVRCTTSRDETPSPRCDGVSYCSPECMQACAENTLPSERIGRRCLQPYVERAFARSDSKIVRAIKAEDEARLMSALKVEHQLNQKDDNGLTPLHYAARTGWYYGTKKLLENKAQVEVRDKLDYTPLMTAAKWSRLDVMRLLLQHGAEINATTTSDDYTALFFAALSSDYTLVQALIEKQPEVNSKTVEGTALSMACLRGNEETAKQLLKAGADPNQVGFSIRRHPKSPDLTGGTLLHVLADVNPKMIYILKSGIPLDVNKWNKSGTTALTRTARFGRLDACEALVAVGADVNEDNGKGMTPLLAAIVHGDEQLVKYLVSKKANINYIRENRIRPNDQAQSPVSVAATLGRKEILEYLRQMGANFKMPNKEGEKLKWKDLEFPSSKSTKFSSDEEKGIREYLQRVEEDPTVQHTWPIVRN